MWRTTATADATASTSDDHAASDSNQNLHAYPDRNPHRNPHRDSDADADGDADGDSNANFATNSDSNADPGGSDFHADSDLR